MHNDIILKNFKNFIHFVTKLKIVSMGRTLANLCGYRPNPIKSFEEVFEKVSKRIK